MEEHEAFRWLRSTAEVTYRHGSTTWTTTFFGDRSEWERYVDSWVKPMGWTVVSIEWRGDGGCREKRIANILGCISRTRKEMYERGERLKRASPEKKTGKRRRLKKERKGSHDEGEK